MSPVVTQTLRDMFVLRGYTHSDDFSSIVTKDGSKMSLYHCIGGKVGIATARSIPPNCILIHRDKLTTSAEKYLVNIEIWSEIDLLFNVTKHKLYRPHRLLSAVETSDLLKRLRCELKHLPQIAANDAVVKFFGWKNGVVEIVRSEGDLYYRVIK